ncbi:conserved domain protein [Rhodobacter capsulatus SB 1003]|uniref:Conserved domain protein n=1 Tax=Rhodobacter capsulatus (strain ATCC BAA-309 / NBRC 16581 / SB1003) TaxID=272942 RepID=D5AS76_RHOCB|nr:conserved domain protein [Rhodobacter capsulatus SB 1003]
MPPIIVTFPSPADTAFDVARFYAAMTARGVLIYPRKLAMIESFRIGCITRIDPERMSRVVVAVEETRQKLGGALPPSRVSARPSCHAPFADAQRCAGGAGDHQLFVRRNDHHAGAGEIRGNHRRVCAVAEVVDLDPHPAQPFADPLADQPRVFADAAAKDERVDPAQRCRHRPQLALGAEDEIVDRLPRFGRVRGLERPHVA